MEQVTYGSLKKQSARDNMLALNFVSLGTKSGNYGVFTEQARILTLNGANKINRELAQLCKDEGLVLESVLEFSPVLAELIK